MSCPFQQLHPCSLHALALSLVVFFPSIAQTSVVEEGASTHTYYDDDRGMFMSRGEVRVGVPLNELAEVAGDFAHYGDWTLYGINDRPGGGSFTIILKAVDYVPGGSYGLGIFNIRYDLNVIWPFGRTNQVIPFEVAKAVRRPDGGVDHLEFVLGNDNMLLDTFKVVLRASGDEQRSVVRFRSEVAFASLVDAFFTLKGFRKNIEWRIVRVLKNLKRRLQSGRESGASRKTPDTNGESDHQAPSQAHTTDLNSSPSMVPAPKTVDALTPAEQL